MKKRLFLQFAVFALSAALLCGCQKDQFDYVNTTVANPNESKLPWANSGAFTYTPSEDGVDNVINWSHSEEMYLSGGSLYLYGHYRAVRYDPVTGRQTQLCTDPVCTHQRGTDCPLAFMDSGMGFSVVDDKVIFYEQKPIRGDKGYDMNYDLYLYSTTNRTAKLLRTFQSDTVSSVITLSDAYFFLDIVHDPKTDTYTYSLCRQAYDSNQVEVLRTENNHNTYLLGTDGAIIYVFDKAQSVLIGLSIDGKTEVSRVTVEGAKWWHSAAICKDGYLLYLVDGELWRVNLDGSDRRSLGIKDVEYCYLTDSYVYYQKKVGEKEFTDAESPGETLKADLIEIYRADHQGQNATVVYQNDSNSVIVTPENYIMQGNYLYAPFMYYEINGDQASGTYSRGALTDEQSRAYCRIDLTTNEIYYIDTEVFEVAK